MNYKFPHENKYFYDMKGSVRDSGDRWGRGREGLGWKRGREMEGRRERERGWEEEKETRVTSSVLSLRQFE